MYIVILFAILEWFFRSMDESFVDCRRLQAMVNTTNDVDIREIYENRVLEEDARVWSTMFMPGATQIEDACSLPQVVLWMRIVGTIATVIVSLPYCIRSSRQSEKECVESSLPMSPENIGPPPIYQPRPSPIEVPTESVQKSSKPKQREYPSVTPDSPSTPRLLFNP